MLDIITLDESPMTDFEIKDLCIELFNLGIKPTNNFNTKQKTLYLFLDTFSNLLEVGLDVYLSKNLHSTFDIQPTIDSLTELGLYDAAAKFDLVKNRFDNNEHQQVGETWDEYKSRIGIQDEVNSWNDELINEMSDQFPFKWINKNSKNLNEGLSFERKSSH